jgi:hypothetical protein
MAGIIVYCIPILRSSYSFLKSRNRTQFDKLQPKQNHKLKPVDIIDQRNDRNTNRHQASGKEKADPMILPDARSLKPEVQNQNKRFKE